MQQLEEASIAYELIDHPRTTTAAAEAHVLGLDSREVAKTVVLSTPDGFLRAALPASERLDLGKVRALLGTKDVQLATEVVLAGAYPDFELGAVPPLTAGDGDRAPWTAGSARTNGLFSRRVRMSSRCGSGRPISCSCPMRASSTCLRTDSHARPARWRG